MHARHATQEWQEQTLCHTVHQLRRAGEEGAVLASVGAQVEVPADEEAGGGGQPGEDAPNANVCVPVGGQVAAVKRHAGKNRR